MIELNELISGLEVMVSYEMKTYPIIAHKQMIRQGISRLKNIQNVIDAADNGDISAKEIVSKFFKD